MEAEEAHQDEDACTCPIGPGTASAVELYFIENAADHRRHGAGQRADALCETEYRPLLILTGLSRYQRVEIRSGDAVPERDGETAEIAIRAALTGHLVFSTLHTNDAPSSINRLIDMDVPYYLVASATKLIMAQRMMRKICQHCKEEINLTAEQVEGLKVPESMLRGLRAFKGKGCPECNDSGRSGRVGIFEVMPVSPAIEQLILGKANDTEIRATAMKEGMYSLRMCAVDQMKQGLVSIDEIFANTST